MKNLLKKIEELAPVANQLEIDTAGRAGLIQKISDFTDYYISHLEQAEAFNTDPVDFEKIEIQDQTRSMDQILEIFKEEITNPGLRAASGGHVGYIPGGGIFAAALGDFLAAVSNEYAGVSYASPGAVAIENEVITWLKKVFSFPETAVGNLASGGSIADRKRVV